MYGGAPVLAGGSLSPPQLGLPARRSRPQKAAVAKGAVVAAASPTKSRRSGAELQWRDLSPAPARGRRRSASARAPRPGSLFPPPFSRGGGGDGRGGGGSGGRGAGRGGAWGGAGEEPRPRRPRGGRCGWGGGAAEAEVRGCPLPPAPSRGRGSEARTASPDELRERLRSAHNLGRAGSTSGAQRRKARVPDRGARADPNGEAAADLELAGGRRPELEGGRRVCRPARKRGTRGQRDWCASLPELRGGLGPPHSAVCAAGTRARMLRPATAALALRRTFSSSCPNSRLFPWPDLGSRRSRSLPLNGEGRNCGCPGARWGRALSTSDV